MARPRLRSADQSFPARLVLGLYEFAASLKLAVMLIFLLAAVLGWATFVESFYGLKAVHFGIYGTWWFGVLGALLAVNIFCAATIRYPWKKHQTGFVITHIGLLTLLFGCLLSRVGGIDSQMPIFEGSAGNRAFSDSEHLELAIQADRPGEQKSSQESERVVAIPFAGGPFNWSELSELRGLSPPDAGDAKAWFNWLVALPTHVAWRLARTDEGLVYDRDNVRIEALDYYSNSNEAAPRLKLRISNPRMSQMDESTGREKLGAETWSPVEDLVVGQVSPARQKQFPFGLADRKSVGGGQLVFWMTGDRAEWAAFLNSKPDTELGLGQRGQVVLFAKGQRFPFRVEDKLGQPAFALGDSGLSAEVVAYFATAVPKPGSSVDKLELQEGGDGSTAERAAVEIKIHAADDSVGRILLLADLPELSAHDREHEVFGSYWVDTGNKTSAQLLARQGGSRIDIVQGPEQKLHYRYWNRKEVVELAPLADDGAPVNAFKMPIGQLKMKVVEHLATPHPENIVRPVKFAKDQVPANSFRAVKLRMIVDGTSDEFWLVAPPGMNLEGQSAAESHTIKGQGRAVTVALPLDEVDVGFKIRLRRFERKLDPGTSQPSHYSSWVDLLDMKTDKPVVSNVLITMNAPVDFSDPTTGKSYRLFQESFQGPFLPGTPIFERHQARFRSVLTVNNDPGRGIKYLGSLLIVSGIVTMFYMRAYFFKPAGRAVAEETGKKSKPKTLAASGAR